LEVYASFWTIWFEVYMADILQYLTLSLRSQLEVLTAQPLSKLAMSTRQGHKVTPHFDCKQILNMVNVFFLQKIYNFKF
jgi:hypothetical protein